MDDTAFIATSAVQMNHAAAASRRKKSSEPCFVMLREAHI